MKLVTREYPATHSPNLLAVVRQLCDAAGASAWRVVSANGFTLAWIYSVDGIARSADPLKLTHAEAKAMAQAIAKLGR
jgi:hypothetical protein